MNSSNRSQRTRSTLILLLLTLLISVACVFLSTSLALMVLENQTLNGTMSVASVADYSDIFALGGQFAPLDPDIIIEAEEDVAFLRVTSMPQSDLENSSVSPPIIKLPQTAPIFATPTATLFPKEPTPIPTSGTPTATAITSQDSTPTRQVNVPVTLTTLPTVTPIPPTATPIPPTTTPTPPTPTPIPPTATPIPPTATPIPPTVTPIPPTPTPIPPTSTPIPPTATPDYIQIVPILNCVTDHGDGSLTAYFGYINDNSYMVTIAHGADTPKNWLLYAPGSEQVQPETFNPGVYNNVFSVQSTKIVLWRLDGKMAIGNPGSPACP